MNLLLKSAKCLFWLNLVLLTACGVDDSELTGHPVGVTVAMEDWIQQAKYSEVLGHKMAYWEAGEGEVLLLIHGFPASAWSWQFMMPELSKHYRVIAPDLLGYGLSNKPWPHDYTIAEQADLLQGLSKQLGIKQFHIISHDFGVSTTQELLARHNALDPSEGFIQSIGFLNGGLFAEQQKYTLSLRLAISPIGPFLTNLMSQWKYDMDIRDTFGDNTQPTQAQLDGSWEMISRNNGKKVMAALSHAKPERDLYRDRWVGAIQNTHVPMRLINGLDDKLSGKHMAMHYEKLIPNPDVIKLEGIGHWPQLEAPKEVLSAYLEFRKGLAVANEVSGSM